MPIIPPDDIPADDESGPTDEQTIPVTSVIDEDDLEPMSNFRITKPQSLEDVERGRICTLSGFWTANPIYVDGQPYAPRFAPQPQPKPDNYF